MPPIGNALSLTCITTSFILFIISSHTSGFDIGFFPLDDLSALYKFPSEPNTSAGILYVVFSFHSYAL